MVEDWSPLTYPDLQSFPPGSLLLPSTDIPVPGEGSRANIHQDINLNSNYQHHQSLIGEVTPSKIENNIVSLSTDKDADGENKGPTGGMFEVEIISPFSDVGLMSQFSLFLPSKYNPTVAQHNHIHLSKGDIKDSGYTLPPTKIIDLTLADEGEKSDEYLANIVYVDNNIEKKSDGEDDATGLVTAPPHNPEGNNDITYYDDEANYQNEIIDENFSTTPPIVYHLGNTESATEYEVNQFYTENENIERKTAEVEDPKLNYIEDEPQPQLKSSSSDNSGFKSDFFNSMNIQSLVFSIPDRFREYLHEPPEWINKDYW